MRWAQVWKGIGWMYGCMYGCMDVCWRYFGTCVGDEMCGSLHICMCLPLSLHRTSAKCVRRKPEQCAFVSPNRLGFTHMKMYRVCGTHTNLHPQKILCHPPKEIIRLANH